MITSCYLHATRVNPFRSLTAVKQVFLTKIMVHCDSQSVKVQITTDVLGPGSWARALWRTLGRTGSF
jgi:hypothetical protein